MRHGLLSAFPLMIFTLAAACGSPGRQAAWEVEPQSGTGGTPSTSTTAAASLTAEAEAFWANRDSRAELDKAIDTWERVLQNDAKNAEVLVRLSRAYYFLADGHIALEDGEHDEQELNTYQKGVDYGERALLVVEPEFEKAMREGADFKDAITKIGEPGVPAAYWYCVNLGRFATKKGLSARLFYKDRIRAAMERVLALKPDYFYAAADRYFGAFFSALPSIAGKDLGKSEEHFVAAVQRAPEYLPTKVVQAQFLAVEKDDKAMYQRLLDEVMAGADTDNPDIAPENRAAKRTAKKMLEKIDEKF